MEEPLFTIGAKATCSDGECGEVIRAVIDPIVRKLTHLIIEPTHRQGLADSCHSNSSRPLTAT